MGGQYYKAFKGTGGCWAVDWVGLSMGRRDWRDFVNKIMNIQVT